ncbi:Recombination enhancement, RecA-dependent nuclease [uncultured Caudovirales phage]|uniref:Recombination enhancement, RecA-dependent nuclease n=1 Tax=uncultured Caudovirales phage TaxID=2100421 RepID=A0A6J5KIR2_9CAUD|nr:Recombination enhancement, RecA-dependent nuclease [uncultured Caudovirales phage]
MQPIKMNKQQKEQYDKIARLGCSLCRHQGNEGTPAELHHIRRTMPRSVAPVIPLCPYHHRGSNTSIHGMGRKRFEREYGITEELLLAQTMALIGE